MNKETIKVGDDEVTQRELDCIISGVRPEDMDFDKFKRLRKASKEGIKGYLKGKYFFISTGLVPIDTPKGTQYVRKNATYVKEK